jgi:hypothetical protein
MADSDYSANFEALLTGHLGLPAGPVKGGIVKLGSDNYQPQDRTPLHTSLDIRDAISHAVAGGYKSLSDESVKSNYKYISQIVGPKEAQKLFTQVFLFNQRPDAQKKSAEEKLTSFYEIGSSDPEVKSILQKVKGLGSILDGYRNSVNEGIKIQRGDAPPDNKNTQAADELQALTATKTVQK